MININSQHFCLFNTYSVDSRTNLNYQLATYILIKVNFCATNMPLFLIIMICELFVETIKSSRSASQFRYQYQGFLSQAANMEDVQRYDEETGTYVTKMGLKLAARKLMCVYSHCQPLL